MFDIQILRSNYPRLWDIFRELPRARRDSIIEELNAGLDNTFAIFGDELTAYGDSDWEELLAQLILNSVVVYQPVAEPGWQPTDISGCILWLKADDDTLTLLSDGAEVTTWSDQSGNGRDFAQVAVGNKPEYKVNIVNGKPIVRFADDKWLGAGSITGSDWFAANEVNIFLVHLQEAASLENVVVGWTPSGDRLVALLDSVNTLYFDYGPVGAGGRISVPSPSGWDDAFHISELYRAIDGSGEIVVNGVVIKADTFTADLDTSQLGEPTISYDGSTYGLVGDIAEIIIYNGALSSVNRTLVTTYLNDKYAIY